jgi:hypothetical protein
MYKNDLGEDSRKDNDCRWLALIQLEHIGMLDVLRGQISVGMFLSWRRRWETVWAVSRSMRVL